MYISLQDDSLNMLTPLIFLQEWRNYLKSDFHNL